MHANFLSRLLYVSTTHRAPAWHVGHVQEGCKCRALFPHVRGLRKVQVECACSVGYTEDIPTHGVGVTNRVCVECGAIAHISGNIKSLQTDLSQV